MCTVGFALLGYHPLAVTRETTSTRSHERSDARVWRFPVPPVGEPCHLFLGGAFFASSLATSPRLAASLFERDAGLHMLAMGHASTSAAAPTRTTTWAIKVHAVVSRCWAYFERINTRKPGKRAQHGDSGLHRRQVLLVHGRDRRMRVNRAEARAQSICVCRVPLSLRCQV